MIVPLVAMFAAVLTATPAALAAGDPQPGGASDQQIAQTTDYAGYYQLSPRAVLRVWGEGGRWYVQLSRQPRIEITPTAEGVFVTVGVAAQITFQTDARSTVTGLVLNQNGRALAAPRIDRATAVGIDPALGDTAAAGAWPERFAGAPRLVSAADGGSDYWPAFSPDGRSVLFAHSVDGKTWSLVRAPATGGEATPLPATPASPESATRPSWSAATGLIAFTGTTGGRNQVWVMRPDGQAARAITAQGLSDQAFYPSWYPDGRHLAVLDAADNVIRRIDLTGGPAVAMTDPAKVLAGMPSVSPDGRWIAIAGQRNLGQAYDQSRNVIWLAGEDGSLRPLETKPLQGRAPVWSPDGARLAFESDRGSPDGRYAVFIVGKDGTGLVQITPYDLNATHPVWSPDGRRMVLAIQTAGASRIAIIDLPAGP